MNRFSPAFLYGLIWLAAFVSALMPVRGLEAEFVAVTVTALTTGLMFILLKAPFEKKYSIEFSVVCALLGTFWILALLSAALSEVQFVSAIFFCFFSVLPLSFFWGRFLWDAPQFRDLIIKGLTIAGFMLGLSSLGQYLAFPDLLFYGRTEWPLANPNSLAALLSFFFFMGLGGTLSADTYRNKRIFAFLALIILLAIFTTGSRGALLALAGTTLLAFIFLHHFFRAERKNLLILLVMVIAGFGILGTLLASHQPEELALTERFEQTLTGEMPALWESPALWGSTAGMIRDHFWTGTGIGTFYLYYPQYRGGDLQTAGLMVHNDPLQFWAEMGFAGPVLFYALLISCFVMTVRTLKKIKPDDPRRVRIVIPACALAAMAVHSHITYNFYVFPCLMLAGMALSFWLYNIESGITRNAPSENARLWIKTGALAALFSALFIFLMLQGSLILLDQAKAAARNGNLDLFDRRIVQAERLSAQKNPNVYILAASTRLEFLETPNNGLGKMDQDSLVAQGQDFLARAEKLNPRQPDIFYMQARYQKISENIEKSKSALTEALRLDPSYLSARQMLGDLYVAQGDKQQALEILKEGLHYTEIQRDSAAFVNQTALLALELGDFETHKLAMKKMAQKTAMDIGRGRWGYRPKEPKAFENNE